MCPFPWKIKMSDKERKINLHLFEGKTPILLLISVAVIYFITSRLSLMLAVGGTNVTSVWPPSGIALAVILLWGYRAAPAILIGAFFANILALKGSGLAPAYYITASLT